MKTEMNVSSLLDMVKGLSKEEQSALAEHIMQMMSSSSVAKEAEQAHRDLCKDLGVTSAGEKPDCPHCAAKANLGHIVKKGRNKGAQRYYCKSCGRYFVPTTNTAFAFTRKDADTWRTFIQMTISGESLRSCEEACGISHLTAFNWRHKILNVFKVDQQNTKMTGMVEADEMLIPLSYKGNHVQGAFGERKKGPDVVNDMPREAYKRGTDNKSMSAKEKACVFCMVENGDKAFYAYAPGVGFMNETMLNATVAKHVDRSSALMLVDQYKITSNYLEKNHYEKLVLAANTSDNPHDHKPEIQGEKREKHMQHVNNMHHHLRDFLRSYCGVSSKYLSNYLALFVWLKNNGAMRQRKLVLQATERRAAQKDCYITGQQLHELPAVPMCA